MNDLDKRLIRCISSIFPTLSEDEIRACNVSDLIATDSLAAVTLVTLLDEEFKVDFDLEGLLALDKFHAIEERLRERSVPSIDYGETRVS